MRIALAVLATTTIAHADPAKLPELAVKAGGKGEPTLVFSSGAPTDALLRAVASDNFVVASKLDPIVGRFGAPDGKGIPASAILDALFAERAIAHPGAGGATVDFDFVAAPAVDALRILADVARASLV